MNNDKELQKCCFCGELVSNSNKTFLRSEDGENLICSDCVENCAELIAQFKDVNGCFGDDAELGQDELQECFNNKNIEDKNHVLENKPSVMKEHFDKYIINQSNAKRKLAVAVYNHFKKTMIRKSSKKEIEKSNILMVGPSGSGKTLFVKTIAKKLGVPYAIADCTSLTSSGYVGDDVETCLKKLIENANGDIPKAEMGIVFLDEIDKIGRKGENVSITRDVGGESVQQALLKMLEGSTVSVPMQGSRKHPQQDCYEIDTTNILFICSGAFEGIDKIVEKRICKKSKIGFGGDSNSNDSKEELSFNNLISKVTTTDLRKFGMMPELLGRLPVICTLEELDREALIKILTEPVNSIVSQFEELFAAEDIELEFTKEFLGKVADKAIKEQTGARALRGIMEEVMTDYMYEIPDMDNVSKVTLLEGCFDKTEEPIIIKGVAKEIGF